MENEIRKQLTDLERIQQSYTSGGQEYMPKPPVIGQKAYEFAFAGEGKAELRILGAYSSEDLDDLDALLKTTLNGLRRSLKAAKALPL